MRVLCGTHIGRADRQTETECGVGVTDQSVVAGQTVVDQQLTRAHRTAGHQVDCDHQGVAGRAQHAIGIDRDSADEVCAPAQGDVLTEGAGGPVGGDVAEQQLAFLDHTVLVLVVEQPNAAARFRDATDGQRGGFVGDAIAVAAA